jgi:hypothetical protein
LFFLLAFSPLFPVSSISFHTLITIFTGFDTVIAFSGRIAPSGMIAPSDMIAHCGMIEPSGIIANYGRIALSGRIALIDGMIKIVPGGMITHMIIIL